MAYLIRQMGHVIISSPDPLAAAQDLAEIVGLRITQRGDDAVYLTSNDRHHEVAYIKGEGEGKVVAIGLEAVTADAVDEVRRRAQSDGLTILDDRPIGGSCERAVRIVAPGGAVFEIHTPIPRTQPRHYSYGASVRPRRIEHVNIFAPDTQQLGQFCEKTLGMKLSDKTADEGLRWYRAEDGFHHAVAMGTGESGLHHYAFDLHSLEDLAGIADNLARTGRALAWGPGRHGAGGNVFTYYADPHGCLVENSIELDRIDNDATYEPRSWDISEGLAGRWLNLWGTPPTPAFLRPGLPFDPSFERATA